ncbi:MAG: hypothetical protein PHR61_01090 [Candidatus Absconditabacteria bacterium]|nr:hypothetical protein [Candidatus Absconditabacteria bacterium]
MINGIVTEKQSKESDFQEAIGSHKQNLIQMNLMSSYEIDIIIDSIISNIDTVKDILGENVYKNILKHNPALFITNKKIYSKEYDEDFLHFTTKYINEKKEQFIKVQSQKQQEETNKNVDFLTKQQVSESPLEQKKQTIKEVKKLLQTVKEKKYSSSLFFSSIVKRDSSILSIAEKLSEFFVEYTPAEKKKFKIFKKKYPTKTAFSFLQEVGEPVIDSIIILINTVEKKLLSSILQTKEKIHHTLSTKRKDHEITISKKQILLREKEAEEKYYNYIKGGTEIYYSEQEKEYLKKIHSYIKQQIQRNTIPSFSPEDLKEEKITSIEDKRKGGRTGIKRNNQIFVDKGLIEQIASQQKKLSDFFLHGERNIRDYILNRFVEYFAMEIIPDALSPHSKNLSNISITKTSSEDDTFGGADFIIKSNDVSGTYEEWVDLIISDKEESISKKIQEANKKSFLIDSFLHDITNDGQLHTGYSQTKEVVSIEPITFYPLFTEFINNLKISGNIFGSKYSSIGEFVDFEIINNPYSHIENLYKTAYKSIYKYTPKQEFSFNFQKFQKNMYKNNLIDILNQ